MPAGQTGLEHLVSARGANERSICRLQAWVSAGSPRDSVQLEAPSDPCNRQDPDRRSGAGLSDQSQADGIRPGAHCRFRSEIDVRRCHRKGFINGPQRQVLRRFAGRAGCPEPIGFPALPGLPWIERDGGGLAAGERQGAANGWWGVKNIGRGGIAGGHPAVRQSPCGSREWLSSGSNSRFCGQCGIQVAAT
jgi:hypothetical protein